MPPGPTPAQTAQLLGLMRARPPDRTLKWLVDPVVPGGEMVDIASMPGGSTAAVHRVTIRRPNRPTRTVVLRRYVLNDILDETPDIVTHEAHALELVAPLAVPTPELLAHDPTGPLNRSCTDPNARYPRAVSKTSVEVDRDIASQAAAILGTTTLRDTIHASLVEVVNAQRRLELLALLGEKGRFDFDAAERAWGGDD